MRSMLVLFLFAGCTAPNETCSSAVCPQGGKTYKFCSTGHAASCRYVGNDNRSFACKSCGDCRDAVSQISNWCALGVGTTTGGTTGVGGTTTSSGGTTSGPPLTGCNGLLNCYVDCNQTNPTDACFTDCDNHATQNARDLLNDFGTCIDTNCYQTVNPSTGTTFCDSTAADPTADTACSDCYNRILAANGACHGAQLVCSNDTP